MGSGTDLRHALPRRVPCEHSQPWRDDGFKRCGGYLCFEEDTQEEVVLRELLDKKLWKIPERIKDKTAFEENINRSIKRYNPEYWRARQSGLEAAQSARKEAPARQIER